MTSLLLRTSRSGLALFAFCIVMCGLVLATAHVSAQEKQPRKYGSMSAKDMPQRWVLVQEKSKMAYINRSAGSGPIPITNYDMELNFDPNKLQQSRLVLKADVSSMFLPARSVNTELLNHIPQSTQVASGTPSSAMFMSTSIKRSSGSEFLAQGGLRVGAKSKAMAVPFSVTLDRNAPGGMMIILKGSFTANRADFATEDYSKTGSADVPVYFELAALPAR